MSAKIKVAFAGCSLTRGDGFEMAYLAQEIWPNIIARVFDFDARNLAISGASNLRIFQTASEAIMSQQYDMVFCQWTELNRLWLSPAPDVWYFVTGDDREQFEYQNIKLNLQDKTNLQHMISQLTHDYQSIVDLVNYAKILEDLAQQHQVKLILINGMIPWQSDLANPAVAKDFSQMSGYTQQVLDFDNRNDTQIQQLFLKLHNKFVSMNHRLWINLFDSFQSQIVDQAPGGNHPGARSHVIMSNQVRSYLHKGLA
jgi:hypothetical protein